MFLLKNRNSQPFITRFPGGFGKPAGRVFPALHKNLVFYPATFCVCFNVSVARLLSLGRHTIAVDQRLTSVNASVFHSTNTPAGLRVNSYGDCAQGYAASALFQADTENLRFQNYYRQPEKPPTAAGKRRLREDLVSVHKYLKKECLEDGSRLFSAVPGNGTRGNGQKLTHRECPQNMRNNFYCAGNRTLEQTVQRRCGVSLTGDIQESSGRSPVPRALGCP